MLLLLIVTDSPMTVTAVLCDLPYITKILYMIAVNNYIH